MKKTSYYFMFIFLLLGLCEFSYSEEMNSLETYNKITTEINFRQWNTKGLGKIIAKEIISVIKTKSGNGNIVILKWNDSMDYYDVEVYKSEKNGKKPETWKIINSDQDKTLSDQHGHFYMIQHAVPGPDGGIISQTFKIP